MTLPGRQRGYLLVTVVVTLFLVASIAMLLVRDSAINANTSSKELESARAEYIAQAGMQHALWRARNTACLGDVTIPTTSLGNDNYTATITGAAAGNMQVLTADQDAWIRSDDVTRNNGTTLSNHVRFQTGLTERILTRFDLSTLPANAQINSATAWFHLKAGKNHPQGSITAHEVTSDWAETTVTWQSFGGQFKSERLGMITAQVTGDVWVAINLTGQVQAWVNGLPNFGILFDTQAEGIHTEYTAREDGSNPPRLEVVVGSGPASPVAVTATGMLADGVTRVLNRPGISADQPPGTFAVQLGIDPGSDALIDSSDTKNYGGAANLSVSADPSAEQRSLIRFDLAGLPAGASILTAALELYLLNVTTAGTGAVHRVTQNFVEGTQNGGGSADGLTWSTHDGVNAWISTGGDIDVSVVSEATINVGNTWVSWDIAPLVEQWLAEVPNHGLLINGENNLRLASFASQENSDPTIRPKLTITYACACASACVAPQGSGDVLLVTANPGSLLSAEANKKKLIESWGYTVRVIDDGALQANFDADVSASDVVYVPATVDAGVLGSKINDVAIGVVNEAGTLNNELGFSTTQVMPAPVGDSLNLTDNGHYITQLFPAGTLQIYDADMGGHAASGILATGLQRLADWGSSPGLGVIEAGAALGGSSAGMNATGRRVLLPFGQNNNHDWSKLSNNGYLIMQRAIEWAGDTACSSYNPLVMIVTDANNLVAAESARVTLLTSWCYAVTLLTASQPEAIYDQVALDFDIVYVPSTVSFSDVTSKLKFQPIGVVNEVSGLAAHLGFTSGSSGYSATTTAIVDNTHFITTSFDVGSLAISVSIQPLHRLVNSMGPGFHLLSTRPASSDPMLMTLEEGDELLWGGVAPDRRVMLPWGGTAFDVNMLTADGQTLLKRSLEWAADSAAGGGGSCDGTFRDEFNSISYSNNEGTLVWATDWLEINESDGPTKGDERIDNEGGGFHLVVKDNDGGGEGVQREADLSAGVSAALSFENQRISFDNNSDFVTLDISNDGGSNWVEIDRFIGPGSDSTYVPVSYDVSAYIAADTRIRFLTSPNLGGGDKLNIDNVQIELSGCSGN